MLKSNRLTGKQLPGYAGEADENILDEEIQNIVTDEGNALAFDGHINEANFTRIVNDDSELFDDDLMFAFLHTVMKQTDRNVGILDSLYHACKGPWRNGYFYGDLDKFEMALMPIHIPGCVGHFVLAIYERNGAVRYYDSLAHPITNDVRQNIISGVRDITRGEHLYPQIIEVPAHEMHVQVDGVNCGLHVALNAEAYIMQNGITRIQNFNISTERTRVLEILRGYLPNNQLQYIPLSVPAEPASSGKHLIDYDSAGEKGMITGEESKFMKKYNVMPKNGTSNIATMDNGTFSVYNFHLRITNVATMDNGTMMQVFKYLDYCELAKNSLVSKRFRDVIQTNRHKLALLCVTRIYIIEHDSVFRKCFVRFDNRLLSPEEYNEWVIRNQYSKQISLEGQIAGMQSPQNDRKFYRIYAYADYDSVCKNVLLAFVELNHENWPLFQHFVRLLTDPFIIIRSLELIQQIDILNLLEGAVNKEQKIQCNELIFYIDGNVQKFLGWVKNHVHSYLCSHPFIISIYPHRYMCREKLSDDELCDEKLQAEALSDFFLTGLCCKSTIRLFRDDYYDYSDIYKFVKKFMALKKCDECQVVEYIESHFEHSNAFEFDIFNATHIRYREGMRIFEFVNTDIEKKLKLTATRDGSVLIRLLPLSSFSLTSL